MKVTEIASASDARLDGFRSIKGRSGRLDATFVAESELVLDRLIESAFTIRSVLVTPARAVRVAPLLHEWAASSDRDVALFVAAQEVIDDVVGYPLHRGVIAIAERPRQHTLSDVIADARTIVALEDVADPDNVGSVFRHGAGFGVDAIVLHGHTGDPLYRKTIRTSMGWTLALPFAATPPSAGSVSATLGEFGFVTVALTPDPTASAISDVICRLAPDAPVAFLLGAEGPGLTDAALQDATHRARIPLARGVDSLNVASAGAIALFALTSAHPHRLARTRSQ
jgi:tRNA G18 (ribose-2'-O)-methylase SpoU